MNENKNIYQRLLAFHAEVGKIQKTEANPFFHSRYADINTVLDAIRGPLIASGLVLVQSSDKDGLETTVYNAEKPDEKISSYIPYLLDKVLQEQEPVEGGKKKQMQYMQRFGSAITYVRRYGIVTLLLLEQEDDDGNSAGSATRRTEDKPKHGNDPEPTEDLGAFKMPFGRTKDTPLADLELAEIQSTVDWCKANQGKKNKGGKVSDFTELIKTLESYIAFVSVSQTAGAPKETVPEKQIRPKGKIYDVSQIEGAISSRYHDNDKKWLAAIPCMGASHAGFTLGDLAEDVLDEHLEECEKGLKELQPDSPSIPLLRAYIKAVKEIQLPF